MNRNNFISKTDGYKWTHATMYPENTETVYSYFESREGAEYPYTVFFGLQAILKDKLVGKVVTPADVEEAKVIADVYLGPGIFNYDGWMHIATELDGNLPLRIKAVPEGTVVPTGNVLMTVENTDPKCWWLTNAVESLLMHVWYPSTVATLSRSVKETLGEHMDATADDRTGLDFMLHDFGYRGASSDESAAIGGLGHLVNFLGTDTIPAMMLALDVYGADLKTLAFSVPATEHSVMTALGQDGEFDVVDKLLTDFPVGILSIVGDSYNIYEFVERIGTKPYRDRIMDRDGKIVVRPDSTTDSDPYPSSLMVKIFEQLWEDFGGRINAKGFKVLDPHVGVLWGDGIDPHGIKNILSALQLAGFSVETSVYGMGGGLLQKVNRDTQRFAFKSSAQCRNGEWHDIWKDTLDSTKKSKRGRLALLKVGDGYATVRDLGGDEYVGILRTVFEDGRLLREYTLDEIRERAKLLTV